MPPDSPAETAAADSEPATLVEAGAYRTPREAFEHGLVVLALGAPYWLGTADSTIRLLVEPEVAEHAREQLACFDRESLRWPPAPLAPAGARKTDLTTPAWWCVAIVASYWAQARWPQWTEAGAVDATAIFRHGEAWRALTGLFLHADLGHLLSNTLSGWFVFAAVLSTFGRARGWLAITAAAVVGNLAAAALRYPQDYRSIGASTAVFAALGLLTGRALRVVWRSPAQRWQSLLLPLGSGLAVLGLFGAGGVDIDVLAHATGFAAGLGAGAITPPARREPAEGPARDRW